MNVFELEAKIGLNSKEFSEGLKNAGDMIKSLGSGVKNIASGVATGIGNIAKITAAGVATASAGIGAIAKQAVESYAEYEQLAGGVETLFGAGGRSLEEYAESMGTSVDFVRDKYDTLMKSQDMVMDNAAKAYMTAGLSANEYMETVTGFSASLLQSLGGDTVKAAEYSDRAIRDMSDNANKMGTSMEAIQNAYAGFSKANYTMLDNLKLGYGGTGEEMKRLIADASQMTKEMNELGISVDGADMSFGNIVNAISVMQKHMDIAGTTEREAASTISGSLNMLKGAWQNLVTGVADDTQDFDKLINNFVGSIDTVAGNILPRVEVALQGVGRLVEKLVPQILNRIPSLLKNTLPSLLQSAINLLKSIGSSLVENAGVLLASVRDLIFEVSSQIKNDTSMGEGFVELFKSVSHYIPQIIEFMVNLGEKMISAIADSVNENGGTILDMLLEGIEKSLKKINEFGRKLGQSIIDILSRIDISEGAKDIINTLIAGLGVGIELIAGIGMQIIRILADTFTENSESIFSTISYMMQEILVDIADYLPDLVEMAFTIIKAIGEGILENAPYLIDTAIWVIESFADYLAKNADRMIGQLLLLVSKIAKMLTNPEAIGRLVDVAIKLTMALAKGLLDALPILLEYAPEIVENIVQAIMENTPKILQLAWDLITELTNALLANLPLIWDAGKKIIDSLGTGMMSVLMSIEDIFKQMHEKAKKVNEETFEMYKQFGKDIIEKIIVGITVVLSKVTEAVNTTITTLKAAFTAKWEEIKEKGGELIAKFTAGIIAKYNEIKETGKDIINKVKEGVTGILDTAKSWGKDLIDNFIGGIKEKWDKLKETVGHVAESIKEYLGFSEPEKGPLSNFHTFAPDMMDLFTKGVKDNTSKVTDQIENVLSEVRDSFETFSVRDIAEKTMESVSDAANIKPDVPQNESKAIYSGDTIFNITVTTNAIESDYDARRAAQVMAEELGAMKAFQSMAVGG